MRWVLATAGHVDHGKSTLVRVLTGRDPDRLGEEKARGLTIELGFAWTRLPGVGDVAFVDVPGHQRFVGTMLAGLGPAPAVVFVVAADQIGVHPGGMESYGGSQIVDPWGDVLARAADDDCFVAADVDLARQDEIRATLPSLANRVPAAYRWPAEGGA